MCVARPSQRIPIPTYACSRAWTLEVSIAAATSSSIIARCAQATSDNTNGRIALSREEATAAAFDDKVGCERTKSKPSEELDG